MIYKVLLSRGFPWGPRPGCHVVYQQEIDALHLEMLLTQPGVASDRGRVKTPWGTGLGLHRVQRPCTHERLGDS